jgi:hypothetical protein
MGSPGLSLRKEKAESQNKKYLITITHKFMTYNNNNNNKK